MRGLGPERSNSCADIAWMTKTAGYTRDENIRDARAGAAMFQALDTLPVLLQWIGWISPLWHGTELGRSLTYGYEIPLWLTAVHVLYLVVLAVVGLRLARAVYARRLGR